MTNKVILGIKPNLYHTKDWKKVAGLIKQHFPKAAVASYNKPRASRVFVRKFYEGNKFQEECVQCYAGGNFRFFVIEVDCSYQECFNLKKSLRSAVKPYFEYKLLEGDNGIHVSDSKAEFERELKVINQYA